MATKRGSTVMVKCQCGCEMTFEGEVPKKHKCYRCKGVVNVKESVRAEAVHPEGDEDNLDMRV